MDGKKEPATPADEVVAEIKKSGGVAVANAMDIATVSGGQGVVDHAIREFGKLDILVNVAGILRDRMIFNMAEEEWDEVIRVHLKGHYCTIRPASAHMRERKAGRIINFSSGAALGAPGQPNYAAAKAAILGLTYSSAVALASTTLPSMRSCPVPRLNDRFDSRRPDAGRELWSEHNGDQLTDGPVERGAGGGVPCERRSTIRQWTGNRRDGLSGDSLLAHRARSRPDGRRPMDSGAAGEVVQVIARH